MAAKLARAAKAELEYQLKGDTLQRRLIDRLIDSGIKFEMEVLHSETPRPGSLIEVLAEYEALPDSNLL
jgi:hypothetical protein